MVLEKIKYDMSIFKFFKLIKKNYYFYLKLVKIYNFYSNINNNFIS